jgi:DNA/RNA-binding domain of Phe-tRNA-synthetase-like protein
MLELSLTLPVQVAVIEAEAVRVTRDDTAFRRLNDTAQAYRTRYAGRGADSPGVVEGVQAARHLFRALKVDPTKTRPSSEALLRRGLKGKPLYQINTLVDLGNWCSLDFLLPLGLYDLDKIDGPVTLREGRPGESYVGIANKKVNVTGRYVLVDATGPFGSPVTDSLRTSISDETTRGVMTIFAPADYAADQLTAHADVAAARIREICGGRTTRVELLRGGEARRRS